MRYNVRKLLNGVNSDFSRSVMTLVSGTVLAQLLSYLVSPIISRLYTPEDMSYLSLFSRIIAFMAVFGTLRYEQALPLPKRDEHAFSILKFSFKLTSVVFLLSLIVVVILQLTDSFFLKDNFFIYSIPIGILLISFFHQGLSWAIRLKRYKSISSSKVVQTSVNSFSSLGFGVLNFGYKGLILGYLLGVFFANMFYLKPIVCFNKKMSEFKLKGREKLILRKYNDLPKYNLPHVLLDLSRDLFVAFYILITFEKEVLGLYEFSYRMLRLPISLIGVSISQVFVKKAADLLNEKKSIYKLTRRTVLTLFSLSIIPFSILLFYGNPIFSFVFGSNWKIAGTYSQIMAVWLMMNFIISPISQIPILLNKQKQFFYWNIFGTILMILVFALKRFFPYLIMEQILLILCVTQALFLLILLFWMLSITKEKQETNYHKF